MTREIGPKEKALQQMREARFAKTYADTTAKIRAARAAQGMAEKIKPKKRKKRAATRKSSR